MFVVAVPSKDGVLDYARSHGSFAEHLGVSHAAERRLLALRRPLPLFRSPLPLSFGHSISLLAAMLVSRAASASSSKLTPALQQLGLAISLPSPSPSLVLKRVSLTLIQSAMLHSRKKPGYIEQGRQERETFHEVDAAELLKLQHADGTFDCNWIARLPHDSRVRCV